MKKTLEEITYEVLDDAKQKVIDIEKKLTERVSTGLISFKELEKQLYKSICDLGCQLMSETLERYDMELMEENGEKDIPHRELKKKTVKTIMGEVAYYTRS